MSSTKEIRLRIKAIGNTAKITKAMEMVAASKMKKAQDEAVQARPYSVASFEVLGNLCQNQNLNHKWLQAPEKANKNLLLIITSDKGLCGSFNSQVFKKALEYLKESASRQTESELITVGKKAQNFFKRTDKNIIASFTSFPVNPRVYDVRPILKSITDRFDKGDIREVSVCFTNFISTLKQEAEIKRLLPIVIPKPDGNPTFGIQMDSGSESHSVRNDKQVESRSIEFKFEPNNKEVINYLMPRILETQIYQMFLESSASEQSARMVAMKNATDSANDLIEDLNLTYNSIRQSSITQELTEISAATINQ